MSENPGKDAARTVSDAVDSRIAMRAFLPTPVPGELVRRLLGAAASAAKTCTRP